MPTHRAKRLRERNDKILLGRSNCLLLMWPSLAVQNCYFEVEQLENQ
jgi:hypothetical protein